MNVAQPVGMHRSMHGLLEAAMHGMTTMGAALLMALSGNPKRLSRESAGLSGDLSSPDNDQEARRALLAALPGDLGALVGGLGKRAAPAAMNDVLLALLRHQPWRAEQLGLLLDRNPDYLREHYLQPLLARGHVVMTNPDKPNDPAQAWQATETDRD